MERLSRRSFIKIAGAATGAAAIACGSPDRARRDG